MKSVALVPSRGSAIPSLNNLASSLCILVAPLSKGAHYQRRQTSGQRLAHFIVSCFPTTGAGLVRRSRLHWLPTLFPNFASHGPCHFLGRTHAAYFAAPLLNMHSIISLTLVSHLPFLGRIHPTPTMDQGARRQGEGEEATVLPLAPGLRRAPNPYLTRVMASSPVLGGRGQQQQRASTTTLVRTMPRHSFRDGTCPPSLPESLLRPPASPKHRTGSPCPPPL